jgi:DNA-binding protein H-NS
MATLAALKKKLANLEAQVEKVTKAEMGSAIAKVRKIMADFGLTVEHLAASVTSGKTVAKKSKSPKAATKTKGSKPAKYRDPATGATWTGMGRAPGWIVNAKNRDEFLIANPAAAEGSAKAAAPAKKATKRAAPVKRAKVAAVAKKAARKVGATAKRVAKAATPAPATKKVAAKKGVAKKAASKKVAGKAVSSGASAEPAST